MEFFPNQGSISKMTDLSVELVKFAWRRGRVLGGEEGGLYERQVNRKHSLYLKKIRSYQY